MGSLSGRATLIIGCMFITVVGTPGATGHTKAAAGPTAANALAADEESARALRGNDGDAVLRMLDSSWTVISGAGGVGEGPSIFPDGIKSGYLTRKTYEPSEARV
jgi:hypothetical protein